MFLNVICAVTARPAGNALLAATRSAVVIAVVIAVVVVTAVVTATVMAVVIAVVTAVVIATTSVTTGSELEAAVTDSDEGRRRYGFHVAEGSLCGK